MRRWFDRLTFKRASKDTSSTGLVGERYAERQLKGKGYRLLHRNWHCGRDEIDLIFADNVALVFVEVRTRKENARVQGYHSVDKRKKRALLRVCKSYIRSLKNRPRTFRFDIAAVSVKESGEPEFRHYTNVPLFRKSFR